MASKSRVLSAPSNSRLQMVFEPFVADPHCGTASSGRQGASADSLSHHRPAEHANSAQYAKTKSTHASVDDGVAVVLGVVLDNFGQSENSRLLLAGHLLRVQRRRDNQRCCSAPCEIMQLIREAVRTMNILSCRRANLKSAWEKSAAKSLELEKAFKRQLCTVTTETKLKGKDVRQCN